MIAIEKTDERWKGPNGSWFPVNPPKPIRSSAMVNCRDCGKTASLSDHTIAANGEVTPSLVCPTDGCSFHEFVTLVGWNV